MFSIPWRGSGTATFKFKSHLMVAPVPGPFQRVFEKKKKMFLFTRACLSPPSSLCPLKTFRTFSSLFLSPLPPQPERMRPRRAAGCAVNPCLPPRGPAELQPRACGPQSGSEKPGVNVARRPSGKAIRFVVKHGFPAPQRGRLACKWTLPPAF